MVDETLNEAEVRMKKSLGSLARDLAGIRTGRANPALVEHVSVEYYGTPTPLNQLATISTPEARLITIQPWDKQSMASIEKAILKSALGLNPSNDGNIIRLPIPLLTQERRQELVKVVKKRIEEGKVALRNIRRDGIEGLRFLEKEKQISQDEEKRAEGRLQALTDSCISEVDEVGSRKETELMEV